MAYDERLRSDFSERLDDGETTTRAENMPREAEAPWRETRRNHVAAGAETVNYAAFFGAVWRRKGLLAAITLLGLTASTVIILRLPSRYVAHAYVALGDPYSRNRLVGAAGASSLQAQPDVGTVQTEVEVLKSPQLALKVISQLDLEDDPEFPAGSPAGNGMLASLQELAGPRLTALIFGPQVAQDPKIAAARRLSLLVEAFQGRLRAGPKDTSRMIDVAFETSDPQLAMRVANAVVDQYMANQLELRSQMAKRNSEWLRERIVQLQAKVEQGERAVELHRAQAGLFTTPGGSPLLLKEMTDVSAELARAQTAGAALEAQLSQFRAATKGDGNTRPGGDLPMSPLLQTLEAQEADVSQRLAEAQATLGPKNPATIGITDRLRRVHVAVESEKQRIAGSLENDLRVSGRKESDLSKRLKLLQGDVASMNSSEIALRALERDAQADRLILNTFISRFKEASQESDISSQRPDAQVVSYAQLPPRPDKPKKEMLVLIAGLASLLIGVIAAFLLEKRDRTLRSIDDLEGHLNIRALGMVSIDNAAKLAPCEAARYGTEYRESVKGVYGRLFWNRRPPRVLLVTSTFPEEGKTTLALSLAAMAAQSGQRTLLVDADFWRRGASTALHLDARPGFADLLQGDARAATAVVNDLVSGADILASGTFLRGSLASFAGALPAVIGQFKKTYDIVIVDSPPLLSVTEAALLSSHADATVLAVQWKRTPREAVLAAIRRLRESGAVIAGAVITMVRDRQPRTYTDADSKYLLAGLSEYERSGVAATKNQLSLRPPSWSPSTVEDSRPMRPATVDRLADRQPSPYALVVLESAVAPASGLTCPTSGGQSSFLQTIERISAAAHQAGIVVVRGGRKGGWRQDRQVHPDESCLPALRFVFAPRGADAFSGGALEAFLDDRGIRQLFLAGRVDLVSKTALAALDKGYRVDFIRDAIVTSSEDKWRKVLKAFEFRAAFPVTSQEFLEFSGAVRRSLEPAVTPVPG